VDDANADDNTVVRCTVCLKYKGHHRWVEVTDPLQQEYCKTLRTKLVICPSCAYTGDEEEIQSDKQDVMVAV